MSGQTANVIDFQSYRESRMHAQGLSAPVPVMSMSMQPALVWVPFWGFMPVMVVGNPQHGA